MKQRTERAVSERRRLGDGEVAHIPFVQLQLDARLGSARARNREHRGRRVDPDHLALGPVRDRDRDPPVADRKLDERPVRSARQLDVERHVRGAAPPPA
jgi:hypothetical protein